MIRPPPLRFPVETGPRPVRSRTRQGLALVAVALLGVVLTLPGGSSSERTPDETAGQDVTRFTAGSRNFAKTPRPGS